MARMVTSPVIVRRQGENTDGSAEPVVRETAPEERPVAAVMLDHEETNEQARGGHGPQQATPMAADKSGAHQSPDDKKGYCCDHQFENAARTIGLAITREQLCQREGFRSAFNHVWTAFVRLRSRHVHQRTLGDRSKNTLVVCQVDWRSSEVSSALEAFFCRVERLLGGSDSL